jgi:hypothetical protein
MKEVVGHVTQVLQNSSLYDESTILRRLPLSLRIELKLYDYGDVLEVLPIFKFIENPSVRLYVLELMTKQVADVGRHLCHEGEPTTEIVFIVRGHALVSKVMLIRGRIPLHLDAITSLITSLLPQIVFSAHTVWSEEADGRSETRERRTDGGD